MLEQKDLNEAMHDAVKGVARCTRMCTYGARIDGDHYVIQHNGVGDRDSAWVSVHAPGALALSKDNLAKKLQAWISALHDRVQPPDLNAAMFVDPGGPAMVGWPWRRVFDPGTGIANYVPIIPTGDGD